MTLASPDSTFLCLLSELHALRPFLTAVVLLIAGPALYFYAPHHRMTVEERVKDRTMTETEARWHRRFFRFWPPTLTVLGVAQTCLLFLRLLR